MIQVRGVLAFNRPSRKHTIIHFSVDLLVDVNTIIAISLSSFNFIYIIVLLKVPLSFAVVRNLAFAGSF